jgi:hypothetical protein
MRLPGFRKDSEARCLVAMRALRVEDAASGGFAAYVCLDKGLTSWDIIFCACRGNKLKKKKEQSMMI